VVPFPGLIYGPAGAVEIWGAKRFNFIEEHVKKVQKEGLGIHSEMYLQRTIFPKIQQAGFVLEASPDMCFLRARADESVWLNDCSEDIGDIVSDDYCARVIEGTLRRNCTTSRLTGGASLSGVIQLKC